MRLRLMAALVSKMIVYSIGIDWKIPAEDALLSEKDTKQELLKDFDTPSTIDMDLYLEFK